MYGPSGIWSDRSQTQSGKAPEQPPIPTVQLLDVYIKISWTPPFDNFLEITKYKVKIMNN